MSPKSFYGNRFSTIKKFFFRGGDPAGYAYIEVDAVKDMMHILESSGVKFKGKAISVSISSVNTMELEWASTQRVSKQIKKSPVSVFRL